MKTKLRKFDAASYIASAQDAEAYLMQVLQDGSADEILSALGDITRAQGLAGVAIRAGLGKASAKPLSPAQSLDLKRF
ncbi:MAG: helix-turn-helix domain-containing transcriptional regulator [Helicobacteraceae bacterium]